MANGFLLGGIAEGAESGLKTVAQMKYQQGLLQLGQQRLQQEEQNNQRSTYMDSYKQFMDNLSQSIDADKVGTAQLFPHLSSDKINEMVLKRHAEQIATAKSVFGTGFKHLGMKDQPAIMEAQIGSIFQGPPSTATEAAHARAKEGPLEQQKILSEINAHRAAAGQAPLDASGKSANPANPDLDTEIQLGGKQLKTTGNSKADSIIRGIDNGDLPPTMTGLYRNDRSAVMAGLEDNKVNLAQKQLQWEQAKKQVQSLNGPQMTRYVGLNNSVIGEIDEVNRLAKEMNNSGIPLLNQAKLATYIQAQGNSANGQLAASYVAAVNTLKENFANLANGGYAPTEPAWKLANDQINGNYGVKELGASLGEVRKLINIRLHAIPGMDTRGPGAANQYTGARGGTPPPPPGFNVLGQ